MKNKKQLIKNAVTESKKGFFVSEKAVDAWFYSLGTDSELPIPEPDIPPNEEKEEGYNEWFDAKVQKTLDNLENGTEPLYKHEEVMKKVAKIFEKEQYKSKP